MLKREWNSLIEPKVNSKTKPLKPKYFLDSRGRTEPSCNYKIWITRSNKANLCKNLKYKKKQSKNERGKRKRKPKKLQLCGAKSRRIAIAYQFQYVYGSPPEDKWISIGIV